MALIVGVSPTGDPRSSIFTGGLTPKTNQTSSSTTGDDGDLQNGRSGTFLTLPKNNPFKNTNKFTDEFGGQDYTSGIVLNWDESDTAERKVLGFSKTVVTPIVNNATACSNALSLSIGGFSSGWFLPNKRELETLYSYAVGQGGLLNYAPFNITAALWTSTEKPDDSTEAYYYAQGLELTYFTLKTGTANYIPARYFTFDELGL